MTEKLPEPPQPYEPPSSVPPDAYELRVVLPGDFPVVPPDDPVPAPSGVPPRSQPGRRGWAILVGAAFVLVLGTVVGQAIAGRDATDKPATATARQEAGADPDITTAPAPTVQELVALPGRSEVSRRWEYRGGALTSIYFVNDSPEKVTVNWISDDQERIRYTELEPGNGYHQQTYVGHAWVIAGPDGKAKAVYVATEAPGLVEIR
ncbi:hypothetical protein AB0G04_18970 [Actinoplanes sp. NPDC023801]|uniref:VHL beta domain-containing protein n=1 Tax=Actinoplanes sp. NPDC023801 TaxID=3154595 RepID=UPI003408D8C4